MTKSCDHFDKEINCPSIHELDYHPLLSKYMFYQ